MHDGQKAGPRRDRLFLLARLAPEPREDILKNPDLTVAGDLQILQDRHFLEHAGCLELAADAAARDGGLANAGDIAILQPDLALGRQYPAAQQVEERRLAGAIGADDHPQFSVRDGEIDVAHHRDGIEPHGEAPRPQNGFGRSAHG